jgi:hypothetical protein
VDDEGYEAYYYRLLTRSLASALVNDLIREDADAASFAPISAPGFDEAYYYFQDNWQYILLRRDSAVLRRIISAGIKTSHNVWIYLPGGLRSDII